MKKKFYLFSSVLLLTAGLFFFFSTGCDNNKDSDDDNDDNNNQELGWNDNWLLGTWEGSTPSGIEPFSNTKIRVVFDKVNKESHDTIMGNSTDVWAYGGTFTWDVDGTPWSMKFEHTNFPQPGYNIIDWNCVTLVQAKQTMNNISLRIGDTTQVDPWHSIDLDWGPFLSSTNVAPVYLDFYGDAELDLNGVHYRAEYPPEEGTMIRLTKK